MNHDSLEKLVRLKMPFGKHAGQLLCNLPGNYLAWCARKGFPQGELGELLHLMHELDHNQIRDLLLPLKRK